MVTNQNHNKQCDDTNYAGKERIIVTILLLCTYSRSTTADFSHCQKLQEDLCSHTPCARTRVNCSTCSTLVKHNAPGRQGWNSNSRNSLVSWGLCSEYIHTTHITSYISISIFNTGTYINIYLYINIYTHIYKSTDHLALCLL